MFDFRFKIPTFTNKYDPLKFFDTIDGYDDVKELTIDAIKSKNRVNVLYGGAPGTAKTMFLLELNNNLSNSYYADNNSTGVGIIEYVFNHKPDYLLIDEFDKIHKKEQSKLLNMMETGILVSTKVRKTKTIHVKTKVFATCNSFNFLSAPMLRRFVTFWFEEYTEEQFLKIAVNVLMKLYGRKEHFAKIIAHSVLIIMKSKDVRDCIQISNLIDDKEKEPEKKIERIIKTLKKYEYKSEQDSD